MASTLMELPLELLQHVTSFLDTPSYGQLRLTCTTMEKNTFEAFAKEFFSTKQFIIWSFSLQTLVEISRHPTFSKYMRKIVIGLDALHTGRLSAPYPPAIEQGLRNQSHLLQTGLWVDYLIEALRNLPNCHDIEVRDFESRTKLRDDGVWRGYGASTWEKDGGYLYQHWLSPHSGYLGRNVPSVVFNQIIYAIAKSGMKCRYLGHVTRHDPNALKPVAFDVDEFHAATVQRALGTLESLTLAVESHRPPPSSISLENLLSSMVNLTRLRLNGDITLHDPTKNMDPEIGSLNNVLSVAPISRLEFGKIGFSYRVFKSLITTMRTRCKIDNITFFRVRINGGTWTDVVDDLATLSSLKSLSINRVAQLSSPSGKALIHQVSFKPSPNSSQDDPSLLRAGGIAVATVSRATAADGSTTTTRIQSMASALADLKACVVVRDKQWQKKHHLIMSDSSSSEEDNDESASLEDDESEDELA